MSTYKCISCGNIKEATKSCNCPVCGYRMYEMPYDREILLKSEIVKFLGKLKLQKISDSDFAYFRTEKNSKKGEKIIQKEQDDMRFPSFSKIQDYVCGADKTEDFIDRLYLSIQQIQQYIHLPYGQNYCVSLDTLENTIQNYDPILENALSKLGKDIKLKPLKFPGISAIYTEEPNSALLLLGDDVLNKAVLMMDKISSFIKHNNIYGKEHQQKIKCSYKITDETDFQQDLEDCTEKLQKTIDKKYFVDLLSDGTEELHEMLRVLWDAIDLVMKAPLLEKKYIYYLADGTAFDSEQFKLYLLHEIQQRYKDIDAFLYSCDFLADKTEKEIFELYNQMIQLDVFGLMGMNKDDLIRIGESEQKLNELVGLDSIKESIKKIKAYAMANKDGDELNIHMCFLGNPGSGKTEVARIIAGILYENKILPTKKVVEVDRSGLISQYVGETAQKTMWKVEEAMGGVLFVDEAYALIPDDGSGGDYGHEAVATLIKAMEDYRGKFCVILAGYKNKMLKMLSSNPGFESRIQFKLDFPNFSRNELSGIIDLMLKKRQYIIGDHAKEKILDITDVRRKEPNFANAREIRNILDQVIMCQNIRCAGTADNEIGIIDVNRYIRDSKINLPAINGETEIKILKGDEELDQLVGLHSVKRMIHKIRAYAKKNNAAPDFNLHMCFYGNPGTGKTEVARIISRILYEAGVLPEAKLIETDAHGLMSHVVGKTASKTKEKIDDAINGVLFIDEAYGLMGESSVNPGASNYGSEALEVLLKAMEDRRGQFCVIFAGYKQEMQTMLGENPGFESRIQFKLEFSDYTRDELRKIAEIFLSKKEYQITQDALERTLDITEYYRKKPNFANARTVRNILDQVIMNQNLRTEDEISDSMIILEDVENYLLDEAIDLSREDRKNTIGFI